jgi:serine kinase of HPr protein (carbohydrate metabolism regulator)
MEAPILVADDQVCLAVKDGQLLASAPPAIRGKLEVRGVGIIDMKSLAEADLKLVVDLVDLKAVERLPGDGAMTRILGVDVSLARIFPWEPSAPAKLALTIALARSRSG